MTLARMWEARAADGRGPDLHAWVRDVALPALRGTPGLERAEVLTAPGERVLLITWWTGEAADAPETPADLLARPVHRWTFSRTHVE